MTGSLFVSQRAPGVGHLLHPSIHLVLVHVLEIFPMVLHGKSRYRLGVVGDYMPFRRKRSLTNVSMNERPKRTGTAKLHYISRGTLTLESPIPTCNLIVPATLTFWFVTFFKAGRFLVHTALSHSASRKCFRTTFCAAHVSRALLVWSSLQAIRAKNTDHLSFLFEKKSTWSTSPDRQISLQGILLFGKIRSRLLIYQTEFHHQLDPVLSEYV